MLALTHQLNRRANYRHAYRRRVPRCSRTRTKYGYDLNGNLISDGSTTYGYDGENRLTSATGARNATLTYDPNGRLHQTAGTSTTQFLYDGDRLIAEYNGSGTLLRRYVHGSGDDEPLVWYEGSTVGTANRRYFHMDHQGSVIVFVNSSGTTLEKDTYDQYGVQGTTNTSRFQFTGQTYIPEIGLYYYRARMYSATLGRFMQIDPIGYKDDLNLYAYVGNDPINHVDPTGLTCQPLVDDSQQCKVDEQGPLTNEEMAAVNKAYTAAVNRLLAHPEKEVSITVKGATFTVKAGELAKKLMSTYVIGAAGTNTTRAETVNGTLKPAVTKSGGAELTIYRIAIDKKAMDDRRVDRNLGETFIHESIHQHPNEGIQAIRDMWNKDNHQFNKDHVIPYNDAAYDLWSR